MNINRFPPNYSVLDHRLFPRGRIAECIVLPTTQELLVGTVPRNVMPTALLRLRSGMVLMLRAVGHAWTDGRLSMVAAVVARQPAGGQGLAELRQRLVDELGMPSLVIVERVSLRPSPDQWPFVALSAVASGRTHSGGRRGGVPPRSSGELESAVGAALEGFADSLDPRAASLATRDEMLEVAAYNYFAHRLYGRNRRQFAATFPLLADRVLRPVGGKEESAIRGAIDAGRPAIAEVSRSWGVAPRVVRFLIGKTPGMVGRRWMERLPGLAKVLDALPPECLPCGSPEAWDEFNAATARAARLAHGPLWESMSAMAVLREDLLGRAGKASEADRVEARGARLAESVEAFRHALELSLEVELEGRGVPATPQVVSAIAEAAGVELAASLRKGRLGRIAWNFAQRTATEGMARDDERSLLAGTLYWPLLKRPFDAKDGSRQVVSLERDREYRELAGHLGNCLWASPGYRQSARSGLGTVLAIVDTTTDMPASTAYVILSRDPVRRRWSFRVAEHRAMRNRPPSPQCVEALDEALRHCTSPEVQLHLDHGARLREERERDGARRASQRWEASLLTPAFKAVLGAGRFEKLLERVMVRIRPPGVRACSKPG